MTELSASDGAESQPLPCSAIVYRALLKKSWINEDTGAVKADAFFLRERDLHSGLSVNIATTCSPQQCAAPWKGCSAVASLHVGRIRDIGLDALPDSETHANIKGLPYREDNLAEAERFAGLLAKQSRLIRVKPMKRRR
ncbi:MAG TPA: hypothetical protein V6D26_21780 [Stenomitos sp.]